MNIGPMYSHALSRVVQEPAISVLLHRKRKGEQRSSQATEHRATEKQSTAVIKPAAGLPILQCLDILLASSSSTSFGSPSFAALRAARAVCLLSRLYEVYLFGHETSEMQLKPFVDYRQVSSEVEKSDMSLSRTATRSQRRRQTTRLFVCGLQRILCAMFALFLSANASTDFQQCPLSGEEMK